MCYVIYHVHGLQLTTDLSIPAGGKKGNEMCAVCAREMCGLCARTCVGLLHVRELQLQVGGVKHLLRIVLDIAALLAEIERAFDFREVLAVVAHGDDQI